MDDIPAAGSDIFRIGQGTILRPHKVMVMYRGTTRLRFGWALWQVLPRRRPPQAL